MYHIHLLYLSCFLGCFTRMGLSTSKFFWVTAGLPNLEVSFRKPLCREERKVMDIWKHGGKYWCFLRGWKFPPQLAGRDQESRVKAGLPHGRSSEISLFAHPSLGCEQEEGGGRVARSLSKGDPSAPKVAPGSDACSHWSVHKGTRLPSCNNFFKKKNTCLMLF